MSRAVTEESREPGVETPMAKRILIGEPLTSE
ncbi:MAG: DNA-binding protein, partial [Microbacterium sp.]|nr:DNA-binding protein [Microbacterium sp.]